MNIQKMMKQAQQMQKQVGEIQADLEARETNGVAGGGMVNVTLNGKGNMLKLNIDDSLVDADEKEVMEDLIIAAFNDAKGKIDETYQEEMGKVAGGMGLPGGMPF